MAIVFDAASSSTPLTSSPITVNHTTSGSDRFLVVYVAYTGTLNSISSVTYNSVALSKVVFWTGNAGNNEIWILHNPASGSNTVSVSWSGGVTSGAYVCCSYTGVKQTAQPESTNQNTPDYLPVRGNTLPGSKTTRADNALVIGGVQYETSSANLTAGTATTKRISIAGGVNNYSVGLFDCGTPKTPAGSVTLEAGITGSDGYMDMPLIVIEPVFPSAGGFLDYFV